MEHLYSMDLSSMDISYFSSGSYLLLQVDITSTGQEDINYGTLILDLLQVNSTRQFLHLMSPSFFVVCIYYGTRYALILVPNYASSVRITIFFLLLYNMYDTCVSCRILSHVIVYCILLYVCYIRVLI